MGAASRQGEGLGWGTGRKGEGKGREGKMEGEREGPKLLLNQGPSEPCYATVVVDFGAPASRQLGVVDCFYIQ